MTNLEAQRPKEIWVRHNCTFVVFCDDKSRDVWEGTHDLLTNLGQSTELVAKKYAYKRRNFLFAQHRRFCTGERPREHSVTVRLEIDNFKEIYYLPFGIDSRR